MTDRFANRKRYEAAGCNRIYSGIDAIVREPDYWNHWGPHRHIPAGELAFILFAIRLINMLILHGSSAILGEPYRKLEIQRYCDLSFNRNCFSWIYTTRKSICKSPSDQEAEF